MGSSKAPVARTLDVLSNILAERTSQFGKWGDQRHPDGTSQTLKYVAVACQADCQKAAEQDRVTWRLILEEEVAEALAEVDPAALRKELVQVAAVAVAWIEDIDSRTTEESDE